jgi:hypothetical protein
VTIWTGSRLNHEYRLFPTADTRVTLMRKALPGRLAHLEPSNEAIDRRPDRTSAPGDRVGG